MVVHLYHPTPSLSTHTPYPTQFSSPTPPEDHPYFIGVQYHPEYLTRPMTPSPPYLGLILASSKKLDKFLSRGCQQSPRASYDYEDTFEDEATQNLTRDIAAISVDSCNDHEEAV